MQRGCLVIMLRGTNLMWWVWVVVVMIVVASIDIYIIVIVFSIICMYVSSNTMPNFLALGTVSL